MPILGIMASQISGKLWQPEGAYDSLATVTLSAATSSITFAGIPSGYKHLQLRILGRSAFAGASEATRMQLNNQTATSFYTNHLLYGDGSSALTDQDVNTVAGFNIHRLPAATSTASVFGGLVIDFLDYTDTNKNKTLRAIGGWDANGSGRINFNSALFTSTAAISTITMTLSTGSNYAANSSFALYGIK
jgi:hypothetical protein